MRTELCAVAAFCLVLFVAPVQDTRAQDATTEDQKANKAPTAESSKDGAETDDAKELKGKEDAPSETPAENIKKLVGKKEFAAAAKALDQAIAESEDNAELQRMRGSIATGFARARQYAKAFQQYEKLLEHQLENADQPKLRSSVVSTLSMARVYGSRSEKTEQLGDLIEKSIARIREVTTDDKAARLDLMSKLVPLKANHLAMNQDMDKAHETIAAQLDEFDAMEVDAGEEVGLLVAKLRLMTLGARLPGAKDSATDELGEFMAAAIEAHPDSIPLLTEYAGTQISLIGLTYRSKPEEAQEKIDALRELIEQKGKDDNALRSRLRQLDSYESRIESAMKLLKMVGKPAPKFDVEAWVNAGDTTIDSLKGKVVLVDFWSVWCGPCIMTFPHLREWREEFKDDGFEIVGVTRYYNYTWDEEAQRASRAASGEKVSPEDEQEMLKSFLAHHKLEHPTIVTPAGSEMQSEYGVTGIPHVVLIDRDGKVQLVKVGAGEKSAKEIHDKLTELMEQKDDDGKEG